MLGLILCGGISSRMGTDKGLLKLNAVNWAQHALNKMASLYFPVILSVNQNQFNDYSLLFASNVLIKDNVILDVNGPLRGVLSVHLQYPEEDLFVLACDMPLMHQDILQQLYSIYIQEQSYDAFVFTSNGSPEPLCAIYKAKGLSYIMHLLKANLLQRHSIKFVIEQMKTLFVPIAENQKRYFTNINTCAELKAL